MRKLLLALVVFGILASGLVVYAAPGFNVFRGIMPETNNTYDIGSSSPAMFWRNLFTTNASTTNLSVSSLTSGNCVQASGGGLLTTAAAPCGSGGGSSQSTSTIQSMFQGGSYNLWTSGFINASTTLATSATTTNLGITSILGKLLATDSSGVVIATTTQFITLGSLSATAPVTYSSGLIALQSNLGSNNYWTSGSLNASTSQLSTLTLVNALATTSGGTGTTTPFMTTGLSNIASTSLVTGVGFGSATTTGFLPAFPIATTLTELSCFTSVGTVLLAVGNGTATSTVLCTTTGTPGGANVSFTRFQKLLYQLGTNSSGDFVTWRGRFNY